MRDHLERILIGEMEKVMVGSREPTVDCRWYPRYDISAPRTNDNRIIRCPDEHYAQYLKERHIGTGHFTWGEYIGTHLGSHKHKIQEGIAL